MSDCDDNWFIVPDDHNMMPVGPFGTFDDAWDFAAAYGVPFGSVRPTWTPEEFVSEIVEYEPTDAELDSFARAREEDKATRAKIRFRPRVWCGRVTR